jgi:glycosyltransferase involved in cell wall biosynthesis
MEPPLCTGLRNPEFSPASLSKVSPTKLNILQIINVRWYNACAHYAVTLSLGLARRGHEVVVAGDPDSPPVREAKRRGLEVSDKIYLSTRSPLEFGRNIFRFKNLLLERGIDIVNVHRGEGHALSALTRNLNGLRVPIVRTRGDIRPPRRDIFSRWLNRHGTDAVITANEALRGCYLDQLGIPHDKVSTIPLGIDELEFKPSGRKAPLRWKYGIEEDSVLVGLLGRFSPVKGHLDFIAAAEIVASRCPEARFLIAGGEAQLTLSDLKRNIDRRRLGEKFVLLGIVEDVREILEMLDVGVVTSVGSEAICRQALEYMAFGLPVVGTNVNAVPETVQDGTNGWVVPPGEPLKMAEAIVRLVSDSDLRRRFGECSRLLVEQEFSLARFALSTEQVYFGLLDKR